MNLYLAFEFVFPTTYLYPMPRIMAIDYGTKRVGIAVSDPMQIIATGLETVPNAELMRFLKDYISQEEVVTFVVGEPLNMNDEVTATTKLVYTFVEKLKQTFPNIPVQLVDERMTSIEAKRIMLQSGIKKKKRREKERVDQISAILILQDYLERLRT